MQTLITEHRKYDFKGWVVKRQAPADDLCWDPTDRMWIDELLDAGETVLTVGDTMYVAQWIRTPN